MKTKSDESCAWCGGTEIKGHTTFTGDMGFGVVVIRQVPATVCSQCNAQWMDDSVAEEVENIVQDARKRQLTVEVTALRKAS